MADTSKELQVLALHIEEFKVMHQQILERSRIQQKLLGLGATLATGLIALLGTGIIKKEIGDAYDHRFTVFLLLAPFPFYGITILYGHIDYMIAVTARYINDELKGAVSKTLGVSSGEFWKNEEFFMLGRSMRGFTVTAWIGTFGILLFVPLILVLFSAWYVVTSWVDLDLNTKLLDCSIGFLSVSFFLVAVRDSLTGVTRLQRILLGQRDAERKAFAEPESVAHNATGYWISEYGIRHNAYCRYFKTTKGHHGDAVDGKACSICGG